MDEKELQATRRVFKKLSALRQTLRAEDAQVLDSLIFGEQEVSMHAMKDQVQARFLGGAPGRLIERADSGTAGQVAARNAEQASEVAMHQMSADSAAEQAANRFAEQVSARAAEQASEVEMHQMSSDAAAEQAANRFADQVAPRAAEQISEVEMHQMSSDAAAEQISSRIFARITLDSDGNYAVTEVAAS